MNPIIEYLTGLNTLTDQVIASDLLLSAKNGVRSYAIAITEAITPEIRRTLEQQLEQNIDLYERISTYLIECKWYQPWLVKDQLQMDLNNIETALKLP
ncbi:spore gernimation protein GerQ [Paenibacillus stellifer]|uniref:Spore gernimation protein GerQ n=1 Tax=Paenibacillus stellifer TaxID=169760 RepID=A0A089N0H0_9BACL|nr:spore coat protein [Paenibacillus stellifer]AIQ62174.1 spore gernimation protein GerQ [Paenibacillus stellifer]